MSLPEDSHAHTTDDPDHHYDSLSLLSNQHRRPSRRSFFDPGHVDASALDPYTNPIPGEFTYSSRGYNPPTEFAIAPSDDHFFREAYQPPSPSPPPFASFLDNILNPANLNHNRYSPFDYRPPGFGLFHCSNAMPPSTRASIDEPAPRSGRLSNGYVDLTATAAESSPPPQPRKREASEPGPSAKRQRRTDGTAGSGESPVSLDIEEVDLTDEKPTVRDILQKQREDAIKAQTKPDDKPTTFNTFNCVICMDTPTDLTATACGHLFCHTCLMEALIAGENRSGPGEQKRSQCPVCRKFISRTKATDIIPLALKKGLATQPRRKAAA